MANLSLNDMQYIINEASKMVLNEITVKDAYTKYYSDIPPRESAARAKHRR